jgi:uncharacterized protein involved in response to NO
MAVYLLSFPLPVSGISVFQWHAHEMIFGYSMAVIAGFLLTAARNWTGRDTASGIGLILVMAPWVCARMLMLGGTRFLLYAALADMLFMLGLAIAVFRPIVQERQARQAPVLIILTLLTTANLAFYLGAAGWLPNATQTGIYGGLYLVLGMVLFMGRRVIPLFTRGGVGYPVEPANFRWNDIATFILYPLFLLNEVFLLFPLAGAILAACLFLSNSLRLFAWHTAGIWKKPLLWSLFAAFFMINIGFLMRALMPLYTIPASLPLHVWAVGGIGIITASMMARVSLGHTGRNVHAAPPAMIVILAGLLLSSLFRFMLPLLDPQHYSFWIGASGLTWIASFALFSFVFIPMLIKPRVDGKPG